MKRVLILGGGGAIGRQAAIAVAQTSSVNLTIIADRSKPAAERVAALHPGQAEAVSFDLFDDAALRGAMQGVDAVLNCAGPYYRTGVRCLQAAIAEKKPYLDVCDDWETTHEMLRLDGDARAAGIPAIIGMGASPGVTNLLAKIASAELDACSKLVTGWNLDAGKETFLYAEQHRTGTHARIIHWLHQLSGEVEIWRNGRRERARPFAKIRLAPPGLKAREVFTLGHPEPLTLPRSVHGVEWAAHVMALSRAEAKLARELAAGIQTGDINVDHATKMVLRPSLRPLAMRWRVRMAGLGDFFSPLPKYPALFAVADGMRHGKSQRVSAWINRLPPGDLSGATGVPLAVALKMVLTRRIAAVGVFPPEEIVDPHIFFEEFAVRATPRGVAPTPLLRIESAENV